jgi:predicted AAA+ superfamily ATPase
VDTGVLWENFLISERYKLLGNKDIDFKSFFWRTTQQQEIDYIEERQGKLFAYEFKWNARKKSWLSRTFANAYPDSEFHVISPENIFEFLVSEIFNLQPENI